MSKSLKTVLSGKKLEIAGVVLRCLIVFLVPFITGIIIFKKKEISPFGENDLLSIDLWGQYFPMYRKFATDHGFSEAMYNWSGALGFNNWVQNAFYTRSIFLIPFGLIPLDKSITYIDIVCLLRFGLGAAACQLFLEYKFRSKSPVVMAASIGYGLCAYSTAFIMQFMWTDGLFLAPLVLLGLERFINGKSPLMYILMLALTIYTNFYTGFGVCLFTGFYFIAEWIKREYTGKDGAKLRGASEWKARGILFGKFALYSVIGGVLTAFVLLPTVKGLSNSESANEGVLNFSQWYHTLAENVSAMLPTTPASLEFGVANIAVGLFAFLLIPLYFMNTEIKFSEKAATGGFLAVLYAGLNWNPGDWLFNGFHFPNQLPGRWSFLFSFAVVIVAANGIAKFKGIEAKSIITSLVIGIFFVGYAKFGNPSAEKTDSLSHWSFLLAVYAILLIVSVALSTFASISKKKAEKLLETTDEASGKPDEAAQKSANTCKTRSVAFSVCSLVTSIVLASAMTVQVCRNTVDVAAKEGAGIPVSNMESYIKVSQLLYDYGQKYTNGKDDLYRMEANEGWTFNTSMIGDFNGIGYYGSTLNHGVYDLMRDLGNRVYANNVSTVYNTNSLFQNSFFGVKYIVDRGKYFGNRTGKGYQLIESGDSALIWENPTAFPIAFAASDDMLAMRVDPEEIRAITTQNEMINKLTGEQTDVFEHIDPTDFQHENCEFAPSENWNNNYFYRSDETQPVRFVWTYTVPDESPIYMEQNFRAGSLVINSTDNVDIGAEKFRCLGSYPAGTQITIEYNATDVGIGCFGIELYRFNMDKWNNVYNNVKNSGLKVTSFKNTDVKGEINLPASSMVMTTIPQDGGWKVYVDGKRVEDYTVLGSLIAFNAGAGTHTVEFRYHVPAFAAGVILTLLALAAAALCYLIWRKGGLWFIKKKEKPAEKKSDSDKKDSESEDADAEEPVIDEEDEEAPEPEKKEAPAHGKKNHDKKKSDLPKKRR